MRVPTYLDLADLKPNTLAPTAKRIVVWDSVQKGMGVRVSPKGVMT